MSGCTFCPGLGVATTMTTTPNEAFPFLCSQLGVSPPSTSIAMVGRSSSPPALCSGCHSLWEEVSLLYTNMQGLVNLMGRRVQQFKAKNNLQENRHNGEGGDQGSCTRKRKRNLPQETEGESMLSWWYPSSSGLSPVNKKNQETVVESSVQVHHVQLGQEVKSEPRDDVVVEIGVGELEFEDFEIVPEDSENDGGQDQSEDDTRRDPSYDPLDSATPTPSRDSTTCNAKRIKGVKKSDPGLAQMASQSLPPYNPNSETSDSDNENIEDIPPPKKRRVYSVYSKVNTFETVDIARDFIKSQKLWNYRSQASSDDGTRKYYDCKFDRKCAAKIHLHLPSMNSIANLYTNNEAHTHTDGNVRGMEETVKIKVVELLEVGVTKPNAILKALENAGLQVPTKTQLNNFLVYHRSKLNNSQA